ncbi:TFIIB-domain-containing protein [Ramicandelaber brevisporus]|nr:TFIIB-domain-containing protein [Ramicandelaber brevisporus]
MCPNCRNPVPNIIENFAAGDLVCNDCGLVLGSRIIDTRSEWRTFSNEEGDDPSRVGSAANALLDGPQLDTLIGRMDGGSGMAKNLNQIHSKTMQSKTSKNLIDAYKQISAMCDTIDLPKAIGDLAKHWFKKTQEQNLLRGKSSDVIIAACILMACKQEKVPRTFKEISALTKVPIKEIGRAAKALIALHDSSVTSSTLTTADSFIHRFCSNLNLKQIVQKYASDIVQRANELSTLSGKSPVTVAAAAIYMAAFLVDTPVTISDIKSATGAHETVTKAAYKALYQDRSRIFAAVVLKPGHSVDKLPQP